MIQINSDNAEYLEDNIVVIKNFISPEEVKDLLSICKNASEEDWSKLDKSDENSKKGPGWESRNLLCSGQFPNILAARCSDLFFDKYDVRGFGVLHRMRNGLGMVAHHDDPFGEVAYGVIAYFNEEYEGGILRYINQNIEYRPKAGDLILHKAQEDYTHEVSPVTSGIRYYTTAFAHNRR
jgi:hypothetical protein